MAKAPDFDILSSSDVYRISGIRDLWPDLTNLIGQLICPLTLFLCLLYIPTGPTREDGQIKVTEKTLNK